MAAIKARDRIAIHFIALSVCPASAKVHYLYNAAFPSNVMIDSCNTRCVHIRVIKLHETFIGNIADERRLPSFFTFRNSAAAVREINSGFDKRMCQKLPFCFRLVIIFYCVQIH